jgi:peptide/nickel transport system substrate-binding protein
MSRLIRGQILIAFSGIVLVGVFLFSVAVSRTTVLVPDVGGTYIEGVAGAPQFVNPLLADFNQVDRDLVALVFNGLTRTNSQDEAEPDLALRWAVSPDGITYLFSLRRDVRWSDGELFTADDVIFTIGLMQDPNFPGVPDVANLWRTVRVDKMDDYTVRFQLQQPFPAFLDYTSVGILPKHLLGTVTAQTLTTHSFNTHPVGTGPFMLSDISTRRAVLVPNPRYFGRKRPYLAAIEMRFYPTHENLLTAYQAGEIMGISEVPPHLFPQVARFPDLNVYSARISGFYIVYLNLQDEDRSPFFQTARVRQALLYGLDRQALIDSALNGRGLVAHGPIRSWIWAYDPNVRQYDYDPDQARRLLDESGWTDSDGDGIRDRKGVALRFSLLVGDDSVAIALAQGIASQWAQLGVAANVETLGAGLGDRLRSHNFQAALAELVLSGDPDPYPMWDQTQIEGGQNYGGWDNSKASTAIEEARRLVDREARKTLYSEFQRIFADEVPALIIANPVYTYAVDQDVKQVQIGPLVTPSDRFRNVADWYINTRRVIVSEARQERLTPLPQ